MDPFAPPSITDEPYLHATGATKGNRVAAMPTTCTSTASHAPAVLHHLPPHTRTSPRAGEVFLAKVSVCATRASERSRTPYRSSLSRTQRLGFFPDVISGTECEGARAAADGTNGVGNARVGVDAERVCGDGSPDGLGAPAARAREAH